MGEKRVELGDEDGNIKIREIGLETQVSTQPYKDIPETSREKMNKAKSYRSMISIDSLNHGKGLKITQLNKYKEQIMISKQRRKNKQADKIQSENVLLLQKLIDIQTSYEKNRKHLVGGKSSARVQSQCLPQQPPMKPKKTVNLNPDITINVYANQSQINETHIESEEDTPKVYKGPEFEPEHTEKYSSYFKDEKNETIKKSTQLPLLSESPRMSKTKKSNNQQPNVSQVYGLTNQPTSLEASLTNERSVLKQLKSGDGSLKPNQSPFLTNS